MYRKPDNRRSTCYNMHGIVRWKGKFSAQSQLSKLAGFEDDLRGWAEDNHVKSDRKLPNEWRAWLPRAATTTTVERGNGTCRQTGEPSSAVQFGRGWTAAAGSASAGLTEQQNDAIVRLSRTATTSAVCRQPPLRRHCCNAVLSAITWKPAPSLSFYSEFTVNMPRPVRRHCAPVPVGFSEW